MRFAAAGLIGLAIFLTLLHQIASLLLSSRQTLHSGYGNYSVAVFPVLLETQDGGRSAVYALMAGEGAAVVESKRTIMKLDLRKDSRFMAPALIVRHVAENVTWLPDSSQTPPTDCFWTGHVVGDPASKVVVSTCGPTLAMRGHISTKGGYYLIDPPAARGRGHVLAKLRPPTQRQHCSIDDEIARNTRIKMAADSARKRRSISRDLHVEVMVTADSSMKNYHGENLHNYILTLMSIVAQVFRDPSLGASISIAVVKIIVTEASQDRDFVFTSASKTLRNFCIWQQSQNYEDDADPHHYDVAVLLSREDFCRSPKKCDTLGLADLGTMCDPNQSCAIVEDNGLSAAFTIAHELGHVLSLAHDDDQRCNSKRGDAEQYLHVMARFLDTNTDPWSWSVCSATLLSEFLDAGSGECLQDQPAANHLIRRVFRTELPGQEYSADRQCELLYGPGSRICPYMPKCNRLWCMMKDLNGCRTHHMPWADGTPCAHNSWCLRGKCKKQDLAKLKPVNGHWSAWEPWDECTRKCGGGIQKSVRKCDNPRPANGGRYCLGERVRYRSCGLQDCPTHVDFREEQCAQYNYNVTDKEYPYRVQVVKWVPKYIGIPAKEQCKLYCRVSTSSEYHILQNKVVDGTPCGPETYDICVNGKCTPAGCDRVLHSQTKLDRCGVCGGDDSRCKPISGTFNQTQYGYNRVLLIPAGSTHIDVQQRGFAGMKEDDNYLALLSDDQKYLLNGDYTVTTSKKRLQYGGTTLEYTGSNMVVERINSSKSLQRDLIVQVLSVGALHAPDIRFVYNVPVTVDPDPYTWKEGPEWSNCSHLCKGFRRRKAICVRRQSLDRVSDDKCRDRPWPNYISHSCGDNCELMWKIRNRTKCSAECGPGKRNLTISCVQAFEGDTYKVVDDVHCSNELKPAETEGCETKCELAYWHYGTWSECSKPCDGGTKTRQAFCKRNGTDDILPEDRCSSSAKLVRQSCGESECPRWQVGPWSPCSASCGRGERLRLYSCMVQGKEMLASACDPRDVPVHKEPCHEKECPIWDFGDWSECSAPCGEGFARRLVRCRSIGGVETNDSSCDASARPASEIGCSGPSCVVPPALVGTVPLQPPPIEKGPHLSESTAPNTSVESNQRLRFQTRRTGAGAMADAGLMPVWKDGPCSVSCGEGVRNPTFACYDDISKVALPPADCANVPKPVDTVTISCTGTNCPRWRYGEWSKCPVPCGQGIVTRRVTCESGSFEDEAKCDEALRPLSEKTCSLLLCSDSRRHHGDSSNLAAASSQWRTGPWARCSRTCGGGYQRRLVECQDVTGRPRDDCDVTRKPPEAMPCNSEPCPRWTASSWSQCSATCGVGKQSRVVYCLDVDGRVMADYLCEASAKPNKRRECNATDCLPRSRRHRWQQGLFSACSATCGPGIQSRHVACLDEDESIVHSEMCRDLPAPVSERECHGEDCAEWVYGDVWSICSASCGGGSQRQEAECMLNKIPASVSLCTSERPPVRMRACNLQDCQGQWRVEKWSQCSATCGTGIKRRRVFCAGSDGRDVADGLCSDSKKPRESRKCKLGPCAFLWQTGTWSDCSATCGQGLQTRSISCHRVNPYGWIDPDPVSNGCDPSAAPPKTRACLTGECRSPTTWKAAPWGHCSVSCGRGVQKRKVSCQDVRGHRLHRSHCLGLARPPRRRNCRQRPCGIISCSDVKSRQNVHVDGDYSVTLRGKTLKIHCADMNTTSPKEYVSLSAVDVENFSEMFSKRLIRPDTCPFNGERRETCDCVDAGPRAGLTVFDKVRLNVTSMKIIAADYRFSKQISGHPMPYGEAGDCYSWLECPQGRFSVDLTNTGLVISEKTSWISHGNQPTVRIIWSENRQRVQGLCGGYCGKCIPDPGTGLQLDVSPPP